MNLKYFNILISTFISVIIFTFLISSNAKNTSINIKSIKSTTTLNPKKYSEKNLIDGSIASWCEGEKSAGVGEKIIITLKDTEKIKSIFIKNGFGVKKYFAKNNRVKEIIVNNKSYTLQDSGAFQKVNINTGKVNQLVFQIKSIYKGTKWNDTCISEIAFEDLEKTGKFNYSEEYLKIAEIEWDTGGTKIPAEVIYFHSDLSLEAKAVPCGDESCPVQFFGHCTSKGQTLFNCKIKKKCYGKIVDFKKFTVKRVCDPLNMSFQLKVVNDVPHIIEKGKKTVLRKFD